MTKKIVKISCLGAPQGEKGVANIGITKFLPDWGNVWRDCEFYMNDDSVTKADYWVIVGDVFHEEESCICPKENILFFAGEPPSIMRYDAIPAFINQFYRVYLSHENVKHERHFKARSALNWWVDAGHPIKTVDEFNDWKDKGFGYDDFKKMDQYDKTKLISVFASGKIHSPGHRTRLEFCKKLKKHFGDKLDWFGEGINPLENKWDGMAPYKYHISLENSSFPDYWTEKLADAYMAGCYPIYHGAPNINDYFDEDSISKIDIRYPKTAIAIIEKIIAENTYETAQENIIKSRELIMDKYNFYNMIAQIVADDKSVYQKEEKNIIKGLSYFKKNEPHHFVVTKRGFVEKFFRSIRRRFLKIRLIVCDYWMLFRLKFLV